MRTFSIRTFKASDALPMAVLVDDKGCPLFLPNVYVTLRYRDVGKAAATVEQILRSLGMAYLWAEARNVDIHRALVSESFLTIEQCEDLALFLRLDRAEQDRVIADSLVMPPRRIVRLEQVRRSVPIAVTQSSLSAAEGGSRINAVANFLDFNHERLTNSAYGEAGALAAKARENAITRLRALIPKAATSDKGDPLEGLSEDVMATADQAFVPGAASNPFQTDFNQHRNHLIYRIFVETGVRRNELRHLKVEDINHVTRRASIRVSKTTPRTVPLSKETASDFHQFVRNFWSNIPRPARAHGYLFTTATGAHLSKGAINLIFREVRAKTDGLPNYLTPHAFRRTWNDRLSRKIDAQVAEQRIPPDKERQVRNRLNGWAKGSEMSERYTRRHIREKADEIAEELANEIRGEKKLKGKDHNND